MPDSISITEIKINPRMRKEYGDVEALAASMSRFGLLQPIVLDDSNTLLAGGRRLAAAVHLGWTEIEAVYKRDLSDADRKEIELDENLKRKDLTWVEEVSGLRDLYDLKQQRLGTRDTTKFGGKHGYGLEDASRELDRSIGSISMDMQLARGLQEFPELRDEKTKASAFKRFKRLQETKLRAELASRTRVRETHEDNTTDSEDDLQERLNYKPDRGPDTSLHQPVRKIGWKGKGLLYLADARDVLRSYPEASIDLIVTDPPYALGMFREGQATGGARLAEHQGTMYEDDPAKTLDMLDQVFGLAARVLKPDGHAYVFFHMTRYEPMYLMLKKHFGDCNPVPIVWIKNTPGIGDPNSMWVYAYEPCFFINRGRSLIKPQAFNYLKYDTVSKKIHGTEKPVPLLRHLISASAIPGEVVLDPFAGSGSTLVAAAQLGCRFIGVERHEPFHRSATERIAEDLATLAEGDNGSGTSSPIDSPTDPPADPPAAG